MPLHTNVECSLRPGFKMASPVLYMLILGLGFQVVFASENYREGFMDKLSNGMKFATNMLGSESVALKVAEFVVKAFQTANSPHQTPNRRHPPLENYESSSEDFTDKPIEVNEMPSPLAPLKHLVRLFGLQPNQISAVAVNALVFVAQMISTFLSGPQRPPRPYRSEDPTTWILNKNSRTLQDLITAAKNDTLADSIEDMIKDHGSEEETSCIRLLVCKITPFVNKMQKAVFGRNNLDSESKRGAAIMYRHLPSQGEINERHAICEKRHRDCNLNE